MLKSSPKAVRVPKCGLREIRWSDKWTEVTGDLALLPTYSLPSEVEHVTQASSPEGGGVEVPPGKPRIATTLTKASILTLDLPGLEREETTSIFIDCPTREFFYL